MIEWLMEHKLIEAIVIIVGAVFFTCLFCKGLSCCKDKLEDKDETKWH